jgi:hypothetical protein
MDLAPSEEEVIFFFADFFGVSFFLRLVGIGFVGLFIIFRGVFLGVFFIG